MTEQVNHGNAVASVQIFTPLELEILRFQAERERARIRAARITVPFVMAEKMLKFAEEYNEGNTWNTPASHRFAAQIKRHLAKRAAPAAAGASRRGAGSKKRS